MVARMLSFFAVAMFVGAPAPARAADDAKSTTPTFVVRIDSINNLIENAKYLAELAGQKDKAEEGLSFVKATIESQKIDKAIDFSRPIGMYGKINADNPQDSAGVLLLPTYITAKNKGAVAKENLLDPAKTLSLTKAATFSALFRFDQIPDDVKQMAVSFWEGILAKEKEKEIAGESKAQAEIRRKLTDGLSKHVTHLIKDAAELGLSFNIDRKEGRLTGDMTFSGKPGSTLAKEIENLGKTQSLFGGLVSSKAAINVLLHPILPEDVRQAIGPAVDEGFKEALEREKDASKRALAEKLFKAIEPTLKSGEVDVAFSFRGPSKENHYTFLAAAKVKEGEKVEEALKDLAKTAPEKDQAKIHFDAEKSGEHKIHKFDVQGDFDEKARAILGKHPVFVSFRSDAILVSGGARGLETIKEGLEAQPKTAPTGLLEISMSHLAPLILGHAKGGEGNPEEIKKLVQETFKGDNDKIRVTLQGGQTLKGSLDMSAAVIKFAAMMGVHEQKTFKEVGKELKPAKKKPKKEEEKKEEDKD